MKTLPMLSEIRDILRTEIGSAVGESKVAVSLQINEFSKENEKYLVTGTFEVAPFIFITKSGKYEADIIPTNSELRIVKLKIIGDEE